MIIREHKLRKRVVFSLDMVSRFPLIAFILGRNALIFQNRFTFTSFFCNFAHNIYSWDMRTEHLDFITFCVGSLSDALRMSASQVYGALRSSGVLNDYIVPCYDVLHTFSKDYLVEELTEVLKERGALA